MDKGSHALDEEDAAPATGGRRLTRERLKALVVERYSTRLHMSLILAACGLTAMVSSWTLLHAGVTSMLVRYPATIVLAYCTFLVGVWVWLQATAETRRSIDPAAVRKVRDNALGFDLPTGGGGGSGGGGSVAGGGGGNSIGSIGRGGGSFDGGGANASFAQATSASSAKSSGSSSGGLDIGLDGDGLVLVLLALLLVLVVFACSGYLIWTAPDVLAEAAFGAALTGTLARPTKAQTASGWVAGVISKTWWPFAMVLVVAVALAGWSAKHYPQAQTMRQALSIALNS